jgi:hypothetical protein
MESQLLEISSAILKYLESAELAQSSDIAKGAIINGNQQ